MEVDDRQPVLAGVRLDPRDHHRPDRGDRDPAEAFLSERTEKNEMLLAKFRRYVETMPDRGLAWTEEALARLQREPAFVQALARASIEAEARQRGEKVVTPEVVEQALRSVRPPAEGSAETEGPRADAPLQGVTMLWTAEAEERLRRIPIPPIRAMVITRVEAYAREHGLTVVDLHAYESGRSG